MSPLHSQGRSFATRHADSKCYFTDCRNTLLIFCIAGKKFPSLNGKFHGKVCIAEERSVKEGRGAVVVRGWRTGGEWSKYRGDAGCGEGCNNPKDRT